MYQYLVYKKDDFTLSSIRGWLNLCELEPGYERKGNSIYTILGKTPVAFTKYFGGDCVVVVCDDAFEELPIPPTTGRAPIIGTITLNKMNTDKVREFLSIFDGVCTSSGNEFICYNGLIVIKIADDAITLTAWGVGTRDMLLEYAHVLNNTQ